MVDGLFEAPGKNGLVMAYGATNAGKTHTVMGNDHGDSGILPRTLAEVYRRLESKNADGGASEGGHDGVGERPLHLILRVVEVYKNKVYDLLGSKEGLGSPLELRNTPDGDEIEGLSDHHPADLAAAMKLVDQARSRAPMSATELNATSSRGHTVWMIGVIRTDGDAEAVDLGPAGGQGGCGSTRSTRYPMVWIVDLAGSERIARTMTNRGDALSETMHTDPHAVRTKSTFDQALSEAMHINLDTTGLFKCFKQVEAGKQHVSYRSRTMTRVLKRMLVRESDTTVHNKFGWRRSRVCASSARPPCMSRVMIINVNPAASEYGETNQVLKNALISKKVRIIEDGGTNLSGMSGAGPAVYGMNGHRLPKRQKSDHGMAGADSPAVRTSSVSGRGYPRQSALSRSRSRGGLTGVGNPASYLIEEQIKAAMVEKEQIIERLEDANAQLEEKCDILTDMQAATWEEAQAEVWLVVERQKVNGC